jgi:CheY-like chemotaxis protein
MIARTMEGIVRKAVLVVDDEVIVLYHTRQVLESHLGDEYTYVSVANAAMALSILDNFEINGISPALIVSDLFIPDMRGDELLHRAKKRYPHVKTILITGTPDIELLEAIQNTIPVDAIIRKPWISGELVKVIDKCLL